MDSASTTTTQSNKQASLSTGRGGGRKPSRGGRGRGGRKPSHHHKHRNPQATDKDGSTKTATETATPQHSNSSNESSSSATKNTTSRAAGRSRSSRSRGGRGGRYRNRSPKPPRPSNSPKETAATDKETAPTVDLQATLAQNTATTNTNTNTTHNGTIQLPFSSKEVRFENHILSPPLEAPKTLQLPVIPKFAAANSRSNGGVMLLTRQFVQDHQCIYETQAQEISDSVANIVLDDEETTITVADVFPPPPPPQEPEPTVQQQSVIEKKKQLKTKKKKKKKPIAEDASPPEAVPEPVSATDALKNLPARQVSIDSRSAVKIVPTTNNNTESPNDSVSAPKKRPTKEKKVSKTAAKKFNLLVRQSVEAGQPDTLRSLLRNKDNHRFALDHTVLETVLKAYVVAAMFEDAVYCLRNCCLPGTLSILQTERILLCMPQNLRASSNYQVSDMINQLCIATLFDDSTARTYFLRIVRGITLEFLEEAMTARDRICSASCERLVRSGLCVVDAAMRRGKKPQDLIILPGHQLGVFQPDTLENRGIQAGDAVSILPYAGPYPMSAESLDRNMIEATVTNTNPMVVRLQDKVNVELYNLLTEDTPGNVYRIDKLANRMGYNRQLAAAVAIACPLPEDNFRDFRRPCPQLIKAITAMDENIDQAMRNSSARPNTKTLTSTAALCAEAVPWSVADERDDLDPFALRAAGKLALEKYGSLEELNASQQLAVEGAVSNRLTLVQGPPGTGKTRIAIRILEHWARLAKAAADKDQNPIPILATSDSNIAVDNLVEGCAAVGLNVVRLGRPEAIRPELLRYCVDRPPSSYDKREGTSTLNSPNGSLSATSYKDRMKQLKSAQIICCTCIGSGGDILDSLGPLERVLVDEATQATEPAVLVPLMRGCRQLVLVGDHCQLPPTVLSTRAEEEGHGVPLFSRMVACGVPPFMLDTQYRMHPAIAMFPSDLFYGGLLRSGVSAPERRPLAGFPWPREEFPVAFISVKGIEMDDGVSKFNEDEAAAACEAVKMLLQGGQCGISDIAVVTPYAAQARVIRRLTRRMTGNSGPPYIEVSSVDGFQGREKEAVIFSAVRSNDYGAIGFTSDWRRINVSFTRARRALIVIGNDQTLRRGDPDTWMPWLAWADAHGVNMDKPGIARGRYEPEQLRRVRGGTTAAEMLKDVLQRQQQQKESSEKEQAQAVKNSEGHIIGEMGDDDFNANMAPKQQYTLEEDLKMYENTDGNWDDSDDDADLLPEGKTLIHSASKTTLTSVSSSNDLRAESSDNSAVDVWDI